MYYQEVKEKGGDTIVELVQWRGQRTNGLLSTWLLKNFGVTRYTFHNHKARYQVALISMGDCITATQKPSLLVFV